MEQFLRWTRGGRCPTPDDDANRQTAGQTCAVVTHSHGHTLQPIDSLGSIIINMLMIINNNDDNVDD